MKLIEELIAGVEHSIYCIPLTLHQFDRSLIPEGFGDKPIIDLAGNNDNDIEKCAKRIKTTIRDHRSKNQSNTLFSSNT
ncbi:hypothetical protein [Candidatus Pristimantibacillus sp. PTI5]|uniref:hypothetical protein n=1 Tax=Candidatus Pristimantibacillus sp. PTI5 TaxID=3400422 RepID=UPI003B02A56B